MRNAQRTGWCVAVMFGFLTFGGTDARAGVILSYVSSTPQGSDFSYEYLVGLETDTIIAVGNFVTLYDFDGVIIDSATYTASGAPASSFTVSYMPIGITPPGETPTDDATLLNLVATYNSSTSYSNRTGGTIMIGQLQVLSTVGSTGLIEFASAAIDADTGGINNASGQITGPAVTAVPEPATMTLTALGALSALVRRRLRRQAQRDAV